MPTLKGFILFHKAVYQLHFYIFIRLFIWTDLQIIRNPFIRPWTWFKGNTGKHSSVWCLFGSHVSGSPVPLCAALLLLNRSIFFSVFVPHTPHTPNRHKTVRAQGHRFVLINVCSVLNCCPLILNSPCFQPTALFRLGRKGDRKKFPIISRTLISSTCAKMNHVIQHILSQPQGQKEKRKGKDMLFGHTGAPENLYLDCPTMKKPIGSNMKKIYHVLAPVEQQFRTQSVLFMGKT